MRDKAVATSVRLVTVLDALSNDAFARCPATKPDEKSGPGTLLFTELNVNRLEFSIADQWGRLHSVCGPLQTAFRGTM
jgi:hypothetical protein